jgi:hypothetical protein
LLLVGVMAATVPGLNILFDAERLHASVPLPLSVEAPVAAKKHALAARMRTPAAISSTNAGTTQQMVAAVLPHDEALAAEHRAAMGILTETTGMDAPASSDDRGIAGLSGTAGRGSAVARPSTSWASVAVDAAERIGPIRGGDRDDRH